MKKYLLTLMALILGVGMMHANPVDVHKAKLVGQQYAQTKFESRADLELAYTATFEKGDACFYVFNVGTEGFVIVSADDFYRPIIGHSHYGPFDANTVNPNLNYMLNALISYRSKHHVGEATPIIASEWKTVMENGTLYSRNGGRSVGPLCTTRWNQSYPYNYYCPPFAGLSGDRFYAGCVATAMSQVMKYWNHPLQGTGSHSYQPQGHPITPNHPVNVPAPPVQTANFGATTYDWANMPNAISASSPQVEIEAVALLMYHCAVAVDMDWDYDGSGSNSQIVPGAINNYFSYSNQAVYYRRAQFTNQVWEEKLRESFDMGWPLYYSGYSSEGGHAFVCDGYDDDGLFNYNWGWGGSGDGPFDFTEIDYNQNDGAIFNFVPTDVYNNTPQAPTNLTVTPGDNNALSATLTWTNPTKYLNNSNLSSIDQIIIRRGDEIAAVIDNPTPGAQMTYQDNEVPRFDLFRYQVYAVVNGNHGKVVNSDIINFGPMCNWTVVMNSSNFQGWRGGYMTIYNGAGTKVRTCTTTNSSPSSILASVPIGRVSFGWTPPTDATEFDISIILKDSNNNKVFDTLVSSTVLEEGIFFTTNNGCGNPLGTAVPTNLVANMAADGTIAVSWDGVSEDGYGYNVYRNDLLYRTIPDATSFVDHNVAQGGYCYYAKFLSYGGETVEASNESCANAGEGCDPATNLDYETTGSQHKIKLKWDKPDTPGLTGFYVYRKFENGDYKRIKALGASSTSYTDNSLTEVGTYSYKVYAYYKDIECYSAPAAWIYDNNQFALVVYWSPTSVDENAFGVNLYPNPTKDSFTVEAEDLQHVTVFNTLGQVIYNAACEGNSTVIELQNAGSGMYMVKITTASGETIQKLSVIR